MPTWMHAPTCACTHSCSNNKSYLANAREYVPPATDDTGVPAPPSLRCVASLFLRAVAQTPFSSSSHDPWRLLSWPPPLFRGPSLGLPYQLSLAGCRTQGWCTCVFAHPSPESETKRHMEGLSTSSATDHSQIHNEPRHEKGDTYETRIIFRGSRSKWCMSIILCNPWFAGNKKWHISPQKKDTTLTFLPSVFIIMPIRRQQHLNQFWKKVISYSVPFLATQLILELSLPCRTVFFFFFANKSFSVIAHQDDTWRRCCNRDEKLTRWWEWKSLLYSQKFSYGICFHLLRTFGWKV